MSSSVPTGLSRFLFSVAFLALGAGLALLAVGPTIAGVAVLVAGVLLWGISALFRSRPAPLSVQEASQAAPQSFNIEQRFRGNLEDFPRSAIETPDEEIEEVQEVQEPTEEELWEEAADFLSAQVTLGWKDPAGIVAELKAWQDRGVDLKDGVDGDNYTLFDRACLDGAPVAVLEGMVALGVDLSVQRYTLDLVLVHADSPAQHVVDYLLEHGANPNGNPQGGGEPNSDLEDACSLLEICVDRELDDGILAALLERGAEDVWCEGPEESVLSHAIYAERPLSTVLLLAKAFDVNAFHGVALRRAIEESPSEVWVKLLAGQGANPFVRDENDEDAVATLLIQNEQWSDVKILVEHASRDDRFRWLGMVDALAATSDVEALQEWLKLLDQPSDSDITM